LYKILIRPLEEKDSEISWKWRNDAEVWEYTGKKPDISVTSEIERDWIKKVLSEKSSKRFAIEVDEIYVGNIQLTNINGLDAEYHIFIGNKDYWGKGIAFSATQQIVRFAKNVLKLKSVNLFVKPNHERAIKLYERCGFIRVSNDVEMILDLEKSLIPQVSVFCMVYNHEPFLEQCLEGFLMQKCLFDFDIVVGEDCSKDRSREILLKYQSKFPGKFKLLLHAHNVGAANNQNMVLSSCTGSYIAMCEGDDYWTDPLKLQKQVDFLEANAECNYIFTNRSILKPDGSFDFTDYDLPEMFDLHFLLKKNIMTPTQTVLFRSPVLSLIYHWGDLLKKGFNGDWILLFMMNQNSKIGFLKDFTAVYREGVGVISRTGNTFKLLNGLETNKRINNLTNYKYDDIIGGFDNHYRNITYSFLEEKNRLKGVSWFFKTEWYKLLNPKRNSIFSKTNVLFIKHSFKLFFGFKI
jgi:RimJ/RimL family protein N-acetyltransferase/glycosyltransferase involved in cell wall biosynthesis